MKAREQAVNSSAYVRRRKGEPVQTLRAALYRLAVRVRTDPFVHFAKLLCCSTPCSPRSTSTTVPMSVAAVLLPWLLSSPTLIVAAISPLFLLALAYVYHARSVKAAGVTKKVVEPLPTLADPDPYLDFDLKTAKTRDHIYVNKTLRHPYFQTMAHQPMHINSKVLLLSLGLVSRGV